jgi:hypothetical protein
LKSNPSEIHGIKSTNEFSLTDVHSQAHCRASDTIILDCSGPKITTLGFQQDRTFRVKSGRKLGDSPSVAMVYLEEMKRFVCILSNGQVFILDDKQNRKESATTKLPDDLRPHGISV